MEFFGLPGEPLVPLFCSFANRACPVPIVSVSPFFVFSHSFLLSALILLKVPGCPSSLGRAKVCPSRHPHFWRLPLFPFLSYLGGILFCHFESRLLSFFFPVLVPRGLFCLCHGRSLAFFLLLFLVFFFCLFLSSCPSLPFFFMPEGIRAYWWFLRILASYPLPWSSFFLCFFFWASGSSGPFFYSLMGLLYLLLWA